MRFDLIAPEDLTDADADAWRQIAAAQPDTASPFLGPDWVRLVARCGGPYSRMARVLVIRDGDEPVGFLGARIGPFSAQAVGAPFCDYQAPVLKPGLDISPREIVHGLRTQRLDLHNTPTSLSGGLKGFDESLVISLGEGYEAYARERKDSGTDILQDSAKKRRKLGREHGEVVFTPMVRDPAVLDTLIDWKRKQYALTNQTDVLAPDWTRALLHRLLASEDPHFGAALFTLEAGGKLAAIHLALRGRNQLHAWIIAHDDSFSRYSPGCVLICDILQWGPEQGYVELDLGPGDYSFKRRLANQRRAVGHGFIGRPSPATWIRAAAYGVRHAAEALPLGRYSELPGKAMRRIDRIRSL